MLPDCMVPVGEGPVVVAPVGCARVGQTTWESLQNSGQALKVNSGIKVHRTLNNNWYRGSHSGLTIRVTVSFPRSSPMDNIPDPNPERNLLFHCRSSIVGSPGGVAVPEKHGVILRRCMLPLSAAEKATG